MNILIVSTNDELAMVILQCLANLKMKIYIMSANRLSRVMLSRYCGGHFRYELNDLLDNSANIITKINNYCKQKKIDVVIPAGIDSTLFISKIKDNILEANVFPLADLETLNMLNNKWHLGELIKKNGLPCPKTVLINEVQQFKSLDIGFPIIIKPLDLEAGRGVTKLNSFKELDAYMSNINEFNRLPLLAQEYIPGIDIDLSVLAKNGEIIAWTIQKWHPDKSIIDFIKDDNVLSIGRRLISCCNYNGVAHIDMMSDNRDKSIKIIEFNPRFWGSLEASMLNGVNFPYLGILMMKNKSLSGYMDYKNIRYTVPEAFMSGNISLKNINIYSLHVILKTIIDPLPYAYLMAIKLMSTINKLRGF